MSLRILARTRLFLTAVMQVRRISTQSVEVELMDLMEMTNRLEVSRTRMWLLSTRQTRTMQVEIELIKK